MNEHEEGGRREAAATAAVAANAAVGGGRDDGGDVFNCLLDEMIVSLGKSVREEGNVNDKLVDSLEMVTKGSLQLALEIIYNGNNGNVVKYIGNESRQYVYCVYIPSQAIAMPTTTMECVYVYGGYCTCSYFKQKTLAGESITCPHLLAIRIASALNRIVEKQVADDVIRNYFLLKS